MIARGEGGAHADVLAGALAAACRDPAVLGRIAGPLGLAARAALPAASDRGARVRSAAAARTPVPAGLRGVHPSWIEAALAELPERARQAVASGGGDAASVWLARWATASIPPMPAVTAARVVSLDTALRASAGTLERWLADTGADQLAFALATAGDAGEPAVAAAARIVGERLVAAAARIERAPRAGALGPIRAAIARSRVVLDDVALVRIGARAVAPYVDPLARLTIMHRLPRAIGSIVGGELLAAARSPRSDSPRWQALAAG